MEEEWRQHVAEWGQGAIWRVCSHLEPRDDQTSEDAYETVADHVMVVVVRCTVSKVPCICQCDWRMVLCERVCSGW